MNEKQFTQTLDRIAAKEIPDDMNHWPEIQARLTPRRRPARRLIHTLKWAAALLTVVLTGLVGYAFSQGPSSGDPGLDHVRDAGLLQTLDLTETHDGVTITLTEGYADVNRIALWLILDTGGQPGIVQTFNPVLSDAQGQQLNTGYSLSPLEGNRLQVLINFGPEEPLPSTQPLDLRLTIQAGGTSIPVIPPDYTPEPGPIPSEYMVDIPPIGPFNFAFRLDVQEALTLTPRQSVSAHDLTLTLEQVTLSPSQVSLRLCYDLPDGNDWQPQVQVLVDGAAGSLAGYGLTRLPDPSDTRRCADYQILVGYTSESKTLDVIIDRLQTSSSTTPESIARATERLAAQGITLEFESGDHSFNWTILSAPEGLNEIDINQRVFDALSEQYPGPWSFTIALP